MGGCFDRSKPELSTLLQSGTFYFAPTFVRPKYRDGGWPAFDYRLLRILTENGVRYNRQRSCELFVA
jgi:hypothetical protein